MFDEEPSRAPTGYALIYARSDTGRWHEKRLDVERTFAMEQVTRVGDLNPSADAYLVTDPLIGSDNTKEVLPWNENVSGLAAAITHNQEVAGKLGVVRLETGSSAGGRAAYATGSILGPFDEDKFFICSIAFNLPTLADATDDYELWIGFNNNPLGGDPTNGVVIHYDRDGSANWQRMCVKVSGGTTQNASSVAVTTGNHVLTIIGDEDSVEFFMDGVSLGTETTNIPDASGEKFGLSVKIEKEAGTNSRIIDIDTVVFGAR